MKRRIAVVSITLIIAYTVLLFLAQVLDVYYVHVLNVALINIMLAVGLNFIVGFGGQISMAQSAFFGIGSYTYSILVLHHSPMLLDAVFAVIITGIVGLALGWPALKLKGHYLALATLGFGVIMGELMTNLEHITGGANGLTGIPPFSIGSLQLNTDGRMFVLLLAVAFLTVILSIIFSKSPIGMRTRAFRDDETAASMVGINVSLMKIMLFTVSAMFAGLAGVLYAGLLGYISPDVFAWSTTFNYLVMIVVGGLGSTAGPVIGALLFTFIPEWLRFLKDSYMAVFGLVVIIMIVVAPEGLKGLGAVVWARHLKRLFRRNPENLKASREGTAYEHHSN
ncbi:branched-chain amino acid ABC transporter permease [Alicyclobacillus dauci]|uniref:Branched-chain amino acid ABC transporter permease n=1 Tax=Alicyclobacillus dauci TaxID=1475485 RepID=A0ABY6ZAH2_9BACL|nr:branched-chain amino acid ABC transporter permease [Alicyclobacillus dauci]WAH39239.1 branched-chain amino acid ABC transporter permease [Alicyclobacillus dauci]